MEGCAADNPGYHPGHLVRPQVALPCALRTQFDFCPVAVPVGGLPRIVAVPAGDRHPGSILAKAGAK